MSTFCSGLSVLNLFPFLLFIQWWHGAWCVQWETFEGRTGSSHPGGLWWLGLIVKSQRLNSTFCQALISYMTKCLQDLYRQCMGNGDTKVLCKAIAIGMMAPVIFHKKFMEIMTYLACTMLFIPYHRCFSLIVRFPLAGHFLHKNRRKCCHPHHIGRYPPQTLPQRVSQLSSWDLVGKL